MNKPGPTTSIPTEEEMAIKAREEILHVLTEVYRAGDRDGQPSYSPAPSYNYESKIDAILEVILNRLMTADIKHAVGGDWVIARNVWLTATRQPPLDFSYLEEEG